MAKAMELVAGAVIAYFVDRTDLAERVRTWLKREPARLAYERALLSAYTAFARAYPDLTRSFFDPTFLANNAVPELAKQLTRHEHANAAELARLWATSLYGENDSAARVAIAHDERHVRACGEFLHWSEAELKRELALQEIFDSRALDGMEKNVQTLVELLTEERRKARERAEKYEAVIQKSAQAAGQPKPAQWTVEGDYSEGDRVEGDKVAGNKNVWLISHAYFTGEFTALDDYYIAPDQVFKRVRVEEFVGRAWLTGKVENFVNDTMRTSGYMRIEGEAGVGKTSFLAHLIHERGYIHILSDELRGDNNVNRALLSLGAQLVARYRLEPYASRDTLPAIAGGSDFLYKLLDMAAKTLSAGEKIVVVCDALDEAGIGFNGNVFGLPSTLPDNVYFIVTHRPVPITLELKTPAVLERVRPGDERNIEDMEEYLRGMAHRPEIESQLRSHSKTARDFVDVLTAKSGGVWMYLHFVIEEIRKGDRHPLNLDSLPNGLVGYYLNYWGEWQAGHRGRGRDAWDEVYLPLLSTLAAAQEAISLETLREWAGVSVKAAEVRRLVRDEWKAFVTEHSDVRPPRYTFYHASLVDFFTDDETQNDLARLDSAGRNFIADLREGTLDAHKRIVDDLRRLCNGHWTELIGDEYARRYLALHLERALEFETLNTLVILGSEWAKSRYQKEENWNGYLTDLHRVWARVESNQSFDAGLQIRCALIESTVHSLAQNVIPELIAQLVELKIWSPVRALSHISQLPSDYAKVEALQLLLGFTPPGLITDALEVARGIHDKTQRVNALISVAEYLDLESQSALVEEALVIARSIENEVSLALALSATVKLTSGIQKTEIVIEVVGLAYLIQDEFLRLDVLMNLVTGSSIETDNKIHEHLLNLARSIEDGVSRVHALCAVALLLPDRKKTGVVSEALKVASDIQDAYAQVQAYSAVIEHLTGDLKENVISRALTMTGRIYEASLRARMLGAVARYLPEHAKTKAISEALALVRHIREEYARALDLIALIPNTPESLQNELIHIARDLKDKSLTKQVLSRLGLFLSAETKKNIIAEATSISRQIHDETACVDVLCGMASLAQSKIRPEIMGAALDRARHVTGDFQRVKALNQLAILLPEDERNMVLSESVSIARESVDGFNRALLLSDVAEHLSADKRSQVMGEALTVALNMRDEGTRAHVLRILGSQITDTLVDKVLSAARGMRDPMLRVQILISLAKQIPIDERSEIIQETLGLVPKISDEQIRVSNLRDLIKLFPSNRTLKLQEKALLVARQFQDQSSRAHALSIVSGVLPAELRRGAISEALTSASSVKEISRRVSALREISTELTGQERHDKLAQLLTDLSEISNESVRAFELGSLNRTAKIMQQF